MNFLEYIVLGKGRKVITAEKYIDSLNKMTCLLNDVLGVKVNIDELTSCSSTEFLSYIHIFESSEELVQLNLKWHHVISAAYNNYFNYLKYIEGVK